MPDWHDTPPSHEFATGVAEGRARPRRSLGSDALLLALGALAMVVLRLWATWDARAPQVVADETAYLAMSRFMAGGPAWNLGESASYMPLYSMVIAPADLLGLSPQAVYRWAIIANAVLAGITFLVVEALSRRITWFRRPWTVLVAACALSLPALVLTAGLAWSDNLAPLAFALIALCGLRLLDDVSTARAVTFLVVGLAAYAAHTRFLPVLAVSVSLVVLLAVRGLLSRGVTLVVVGGVVGGIAAIDAVAAHLAVALNMSGRDAGEFGRLFDVPALLTSTVGQAWYLAVTTGGLALFGGLALARSSGSAVRDRWRSGTVEPAPRAPVRTAEDPLGGPQVILLLALIGIAFATSAGFMADRPRPDQLVYGRYNDMLAAPLVVLGLASLTTAPRRRIVVDLLAVAGTATLAASVLWINHLEMLRGPFMPHTILGLFALDPIATQRLRYITVVGLGWTAAVTALAVLSRRINRPLLVVGGCLVLFALALPRGEAASDRYVHSDPSVAEGLETVLAPGQEIVCASTAGCPLLEFYRFQFYLSDNPFLLAWDEGWRGSPVILAGPDQGDAAVLDGLGYEEVWRDASTGATIWTLG